MTTFDEREQAFENKFKHDEELLFRIYARRAKLVGLWAAGQLGLAGADADAYAKRLVDIDFNEPHHHDIVRQVKSDLDAKGLDVSEHRIQREMETQLDIARQQVNAE